MRALAARTPLGEYTTPSPSRAHRAGTMSRRDAYSGACTHRRNERASTSVYAGGNGRARGREREKEREREGGSRRPATRSVSYDEG